MIDAQVHCYERDHPGRPWKAVLAGPPEVTGDQMVKAMDAVGVGGAILVSVHTMYRFDESYAVGVQQQHPDRFALVKPFDPREPDTADELMAAWAATPGAVGARIMLTHSSEDPADPGIAAIAAAAGRHGLPVNMLCWGRLDQMAAIAAAHPDTRFVIDHLGLEQPFAPPTPADPFAELPGVLALAAHDNVVIKITGACTLSHEPFPYTDLWPHLEQIFDAYGLDRCLWGTDWTRATELLTYPNGVESFTSTDRLADSDRQTLMHESCARVYGWSPA